MTLDLPPHDPPPPPRVHKASFDQVIRGVIRVARRGVKGAGWRGVGESVKAGRENMGEGGKGGGVEGLWRV